MNAKQIWQAALGELQIQLSRPNFETWLRQAVAVSADDERFVLRAHSTFAAEWLDRRLRPQIEQSLRRVIGHPVVLEVVVGHAPRAAPVAPRTGSTGRVAVEDPPEATSTETPLTQPVVSPPSNRTPTRRRLRPAATTAAIEEPTLEEPSIVSPRSSESTWAAGDWLPNPLYTFDTFTTGKSNQTAFAAAMSVADDPGRGYNPLFIYGGVGLGKTHLMHAVANVVVRKGLRTLYVTAEDFTNQIVTAIMEHRTEDFRLRYRKIEVLLVDDVQFIAGKEATQEEFFHTFNALHGVGHQIVLTSDRPPKAIANLAERLQSRFAWGIAVDVQLPDLETRRAILQAKSRLQRIDLPDEVINFLATAINSNIRELEGGLNRVVAYSRLMNQPISVQMARAAIEDLILSVQRRLVGPSDVVDAVCRYYKVDPRIIRGKSRDREVVLPRQVAMYLMRQKTQASLVDIGRELGGKDHSTVLHGCDRIQRETQADVQLRRDLDAIEELLRQAAR